MDSSPCRTCLLKHNEVHSLWKEVNVLDRSEILKDILLECTAIEVLKFVADTFV